MRWITFITVSLVVCFSIQYLPAKAETNCIHDDKHANDCNQGTNNNPIVIKIAPSPSDDAETKHEDNETKTRVATERLFWGTLALAIFTFFLWRSTYKLVKDAKDTSKRDLRAYVGTEDIFFQYGIPIFEKLGLPLWFTDIQR